MLVPGHWLPVKDGDERAFSIYRRHYTFTDYKDNRRQPGYRNRFHIAGPGEKMVLVTQNLDALFVWRKFLDRSGQQGVNCAAFRNESQILSSLLILEAEQLAWQKWPGDERLYTYVNVQKIRRFNLRHRQARPPGWCFIQAGWTLLEQTTRAKKLAILEKLP
jgi:hypothetical protein